MMHAVAMEGCFFLACSFCFVSLLFSFSYVLHPYCSFPALFSSQSLPHTPLPPQIHSSSVSLPKRAGLQGISTKHDSSSYKKIRHFSSFYSRMKQPNRRNKVPKAGRDSPCSLF